MRFTGLPSRSALLAAGAAAACVAGLATPASAGFTPDSDDWGVVVPNAGCVHAEAFAAQVKGLGGSADSVMFQSHYPTLPTAPATAGGGSDLINLNGFGKGTAIATRAVGHAYPGEPGVQNSALVPTPCGAYAEAQGASIDVGSPYVPNPTGGVPLSPFGIHLEAIAISAATAPGQPVKLHGGAAGGYISSFGKKVINIPKLWAANFGLRVPADYSQPAIALASTNEQVTTDSDGVPTLDASGHYKFDPTAASGYVNAAHASILGTNASDAIVGHAAVLRDASAPIPPLSSLPKLPPAPAPVTGAGGLTLPKLPLS
ncbi:hypothetical protein GCM10027589_24450 [Actinocorallia lasiicapitis]